MARSEPVAVRSISRAPELPVPFVSAICNERLQARHRRRAAPVRLTPRGRRLFAATALRLPLDATCTRARAASRDPARARARGQGARCPRGESAPARVEIDQAHCTVETKIRRVLALYEVGALDDKQILLLGDDDLTALAIKLVVEHLAPGATIRGLVVLTWTPTSSPSSATRCAGALRLRVPRTRPPRPPARPAPRKSRHPFSSILRTRAGEPSSSSPARQRPRPDARGDVFLAFGPRRAEESLRVQRSIAELGFTVRSLVRNFNDYLGAGRWAERATSTTW